MDFLSVQCSVLSSSMKPFAACCQQGEKQTDKIGGRLARKRGLQVSGDETRRYGENRRSLPEANVDVSSKRCLMILIQNHYRGINSTSLWLSSLRSYWQKAGGRDCRSMRIPSNNYLSSCICGTPFKPTSIFSNCP